MSEYLDFIEQVYRDKINRITDAYKAVEALENEMPWEFIVAHRAQIDMEFYLADIQYLEDRE